MPELPAQPARALVQAARSPEKTGIEGLLEEKAGQLLLELVSAIPHPQIIPSDDPLTLAQQLISKAATKASLLSATLSLPGGPLGLLSTLPDIAGIWRIQAQLVSDIAAAYGKTVLLQREEMVWCLFRHATAQLLRDLAVRAGRRMLVQKLSSTALSLLLNRIGMASARRLVGRSLPRFLPLLGAAACGTFAWIDTRAVGKTALEYFSSAES
jgi:hypothetical protein